MGYDITYDNIAHQYTIRHKYHPPTTFTRNIDGLYILPRSSIPHPKSSHIYATDTTTTPTIKLSKREQKTVDIALSLHERCGHCGDDRLINLINSGKIINCPITAQQYLKARKYAGP